MRTAALTAATVLAASIALAFLALPLVAIFAHTSPGRLIDQLSNPVVEDAFIVSVKTSLIAQLLIVVLGTPTAYAVAGIGLLAAFGRVGLLGSSLRGLGITVPFTQAAVTLAVAFVASPLYVRT